MSVPNQRIHIEDGSLDPTNIVYVWIQGGPPSAVVYVGATSLPLAARTWLHLNDSDPEIGRVRARHPEALSGALDVLGFELDPTIDRRAVKEAVTALLRGAPPPTTTSQVALDAATRIVAELREHLPSR